MPDRMKDVRVLEFSQVKEMLSSGKILKIQNAKSADIYTLATVDGLFVLIAHRQGEESFLVEI